MGLVGAGRRCAAVSRRRQAPGRSDAGAILISAVPISTAATATARRLTVRPVWCSCSAIVGPRIAATQCRSTGRIAGVRIKAASAHLGRIASAVPDPHAVSGRLEARPVPIRSTTRRVFRGTFEFRGEMGYTEIDAERRKGQGRCAFRRSACLRRSRRSMAARRPPGALSASTRRSDDAPLRNLGAAMAASALVTAISAFPGSAVGFASKRHGGDEREQDDDRAPGHIPRSASPTRSAVERSSGDSRPSALAAKPFSGTATFQELGRPGELLDGHRWRDCAARVSAAMSFAGPTSRRTFCRRLTKSSPAAPAGADSQETRLIDLLQGSGSQSQAFAEVRLSWSR